MVHTQTISKYKSPNGVFQLSNENKKYAVAALTVINNGFKEVYQDDDNEFFKSGLNKQTNGNENAKNITDIRNT
jgi:hypothetical protein